MGDITGWDFTDNVLNSTTQLINRQKSAMNLEILRLNKTKRKAFFFDPKNGEIKASLASCECRDFNFSGKSHKKKFTPCMHIYRIAIELELMPVKYLDRKAQLALMSYQERKLDEAKRLREIPSDPTQWGSWAEKVHSPRCQQDRQYRAYELMEEKSGFSYHTGLDSCSCPDFNERGAPCKHIYYLALTKGYDLKVTREDFELEKNQFGNNGG